MQKQSDKLCKIIIRDLATKFKIDPKLIVTRLLDKNDKEDMRNGLLTIEVLESHIKAWIEIGIPDVAHGKTTPLSPNEKAELEDSYSK